MNDVDFNVSLSVLPKFLRIEGFSKLTKIEVLAVIQTVVSKLQCEVYPVQWQVGYLAIPSYVKVVGCLDIGIYPMNISSSIPVSFLNVRESSKILDLCCCPGGKLLSIHDMLQSCTENITKPPIIVGVDISKSRLNTCCSLIRQSLDYLNINNTNICTEEDKEDVTADEIIVKQDTGSPRCLLFHADGTIFANSDNSNSRSFGEFVFDSAVHFQEQRERGLRKRINKSAKMRQRKRLKTSLNEFQSKFQLEFKQGFDAVLVDSQCTHDGSYKHNIIRSHITNKSDDFEDEVRESKRKFSTGIVTVDNPAIVDQIHENNSDTLDSCQIDLQTLQRSLLRNGFSLLRPGGLAVYSTCSALEPQGEEIVRWLLDTQANAELVSLDAGESSVGSSTWDLARIYGDADSSKWSEVVEEWYRIRTSSTSKTSDIPLDTTSNTVLEGTLTLEDLHKILMLEDVSSCCRQLLQHDPIRTSDLLCELVARKFSVPPFEPSSVLPGTLRLSYKGAVSGMFVACLKKKIL